MVERISFFLPFRIEGTTDGSGIDVFGILGSKNEGIVVYLYCFIIMSF